MVSSSSMMRTSSFSPSGFPMRDDASGVAVGAVSVAMADDEAAAGVAVCDSESVDAGGASDAGAAGGASNCASRSVTTSLAPARPVESALRWRLASAFSPQICSRAEDERARTWRRLFSRDTDFWRLALSAAEDMRLSVAIHAPVPVFWRGAFRGNAFSTCSFQRAPV